jgi:hypothetical protein
LVAVAPAVHGALDEAALSAEARVELCKCPSHGVALSLVVEAVALVLVLVAARAGVDAVLRLELLGKLVDVDGLDIAADGVFHLDAVSRVLECDPLDAVLVLSDDQRSCCGNWAWRSVGVHV